MKALKIAMFGLAVAVGGVLGATTGVQETAAIPCCSTCLPNYNRCITGCAGSASCEATCETRLASCESNCSDGC